MNDILDSIDLCFLQEHWLISDQLHKLNINCDFLSTSVSGVDSSLFLVGRPFGGYAILYRKSLSLSISLIPVSSNRFCAIKVSTLDGGTLLMFCVYMPYENHLSSFTDYLNTLGEIQGLLDAHSHTGIFLIGDFNVDFNAPVHLLTCLTVSCLSWIWYHLILDLEILSCLPMNVIVMGCIGLGLIIFCAQVPVPLL